MPARINWKIVAVAVLAGSSVIGGSRSWPSLCVLLFGLFNAFAVAPGTLAVRTVSIAAAVVTLLFPHDYMTWMKLFAWLPWPPAFLVAWALGAEAGRDGAPPDRSNAGRHARTIIAIICVAVGFGSAAFRFMTHARLEQSAALFIGIPTLMALIVTMAVRPRSATGVACKAVTVGLLISLIFLGEGVLCIAMSAPLFYAVAVAVAALMRWARENGGTARRTTSGLMLLALLPMSVEGITPGTSLSRDEVVTETRIVSVPSTQIDRVLNEAPRFPQTPPLYLRMGFPRPISSAVDRNSTRPRWIIRFRGGETRLNGTEPKTGDLVLELDEARQGFAHWRVLSDTSHMTHFLEWRESTLTWEAVGPDTTRVTWTLRYDRRLDPAWYFAPWERYAVRLAAGYLIDTVANQ